MCLRESMTDLRRGLRERKIRRLHVWATRPKRAVGSNVDAQHLGGFETSAINEREGDESGEVVKCVVTRFLCFY